MRDGDRRIETLSVLRRGAALVTMAALVGLVACSSPESTAKTKPERKKDQPVPGGCVKQLEEKNATPACQDEVYLQAVRSGDFPELKTVQDAQLVAFVRGLCSYAEGLTPASKAEQPFYGDLLASTATSWGVPVKTVDAVSRSTRLMCPDGFQILSKLPRSEGGIQVELSVTGTGTADIAYSMPDGSTEQISGSSLPWGQTIHLPQPSAVTVNVNPMNGAKAGCRITVNDTIVDSERDAETPATCEVSSKDVGAAAAKGGSRG